MLISVSVSGAFITTLGSVLKVKSKLLKFKFELVLITTKKGEKYNIKINTFYNTSVLSVRKKYDMLDGYDTISPSISVNCYC